MDSFIDKDMGAVATGWFTSSANFTANDIITIGAVSIEFDGVGANLNVVVGGSLAITLASAVVAINGDAAIGVHAIVGANDSTLNLVAKVAGTAGNLVTTIDVDFAGVIAVSAGTMLGGTDVAVSETYRTSYTITAEDIDVLAAGNENAELCIAAVPQTTAPAFWNVMVYDVSGFTFLASTSLKFTWKQVGADFYGMCIEDDGPIYQAGDIINILAVY